MSLRGGATFGDIVAEHTVGESEVSGGAEGQVTDDETIGLPASLSEHDHVRKTGLLGGLNEIVNSVVPAINGLRVGDAQFDFSE